MENKLELIISYIKILILPILLGMPLLLLFGTDTFINALGINNQIQIELIIVFVLLAIISFKNIKFNRDVFVLFLLPLVSYLYVKDQILALQHYGFYFIYILLYMIFYRSKNSMLIYKTISWMSIILALYVIFQITSVFPILLQDNAIKSEYKDILLQHRQFSTFYLPNIYAAFLLIALFISNYIYKKEHKLLYGIITLVNIIMLVSTMTFIAYILLSVFTVYKLLKQKLWKAMIIVILTAIGLFIVIRPPESLMNSFHYRTNNYQAAFEMYKDNPVLGVGTNNFDLYYPLYKQKDSNYIHNAHSMIMQNLADHGVWGIIILILFIKIILSVKQSPLFPMFILLSIYFALDLVYYVPAIGGLFWLLIAINQPENEVKPIKYIPKLVMIPLLLGYFIVIIIQHYYTPLSYLEKEKQKIQSDYDNGLYYSSWIRTIELKDYYEQSKTD